MKVKDMNAGVLLAWVTTWEELNGLDKGDGYRPYFDSALRIAKSLGFKPYGSKDGSHFGVLFKDEELEEILKGLDRRWLKQVP